MSPETSAGVEPGQSVLVAGRVTGYRTFSLRDDRLAAAFDTSVGTWARREATATCGRGREHPAPDIACDCGLHAWYHLADARVHARPGDVVGVVRAEGRVVLAEHGFRAERATVEAVLLPSRWWTPRARRQRVERVVLDRYPGTEVHASAGRLEAAFPADDLSALGVEAAPTPLGRHQRSWDLVWVLGVVAAYSMVAWPEAAQSALRAGGWVALVTAFVGWQAWLISRGFRATR